MKAIARWAMILATALMLPQGVLAQDDDCDEACQAARNAQDPLAPVTALLTDNTLTFDNSGGNSTENYQLQPVYSIEFGEAGHLILRGLLNYNRVPTPTGTESGLGDSIFQAFWVPNARLGNLRYGFGPQIAFDTADEPELGGLGDGFGLAAVAFGFTGDLSYGGVLGHIWGENDVEVTTLQPIVFYNTEFLGGSYFGYSNTIVYNSAAPSGSRWTVPLGITFGKTFVQPNGGAIDFNFGLYRLVERPRGANGNQFKFGLSYFFP